MKKILIILFILTVVSFSYDSKKEGAYFYHMPLDEFAFLISKTDNINVIISDDVDSSTNLFVSDTPDKLLEAFKISLSLAGYQLSKKNGFYYVHKEEFIDKKLSSYYVYQLVGDIYEQIKPIIKEVDHSYISSSNRIVFNCDFSTFSLVKKILSQVDQPKNIYHLKVTIFDVNNKLIDNKGFDSSFVSQISTSSFNMFMDILRVRSSSASPYLGDKKVSFYSFLGDLTDKNLAKIKTSQFLNTLDGVETFLSDVQQIPVLDSSKTVDDVKTIDTNSYTYKDVGLRLKLKSSFMTKEVISINFDFEHSVVMENINYLPILSSKHSNSMVRLAKGDAVVLGGFRRNYSIKRETSVPFLKDIPILGYLFNYITSEESDITSYIILEYLEDDLDLLSIFESEEGLF